MHLGAWELIVRMMLLNQLCRSVHAGPNAWAEFHAADASSSCSEAGTQRQSKCY